MEFPGFGNTTVGSQGRFQVGVIFSRNFQKEKFKIKTVEIDKAVTP